MVLWDHESKEDIMINAGKTIFPIIWVTESTEISPQTIMIKSPLSIMIKRNTEYKREMGGGRKRKTKREKRRERERKRKIVRCIYIYIYK